MKGKRYTDEFKKEAVKQVTDRGYSVSEVAKRLGTTTHSLYLWLKKYGDPSPRQADKADLTVENARLKADLKRMTEERDILKKAARRQCALLALPRSTFYHSPEPVSGSALETLFKPSARPLFMASINSLYSPCLAYKVDSDIPKQSAI